MQFHRIITERNDNTMESRMNNAAREGFKLHQFEVVVTGERLTPTFCALMIKEVP